MGFYGAACMVTGVGLFNGNDPAATAVLLRRTENGHSPISLGLHGEYDGYGKIDCVEDEPHTELILAYCKEQQRLGRLFIEDVTCDPDFQELFTEASDFDSFLYFVERTCALAAPYENADLPPSTTFDGDYIVFALVAQRVWDAVAATADMDEPVEAAFRRVFADAEIPWALYGGRLAEFEDEVRQLAAVHDLLAARGMPWASQGKERQRYPHGMDRDNFLELADQIAEAKRDYHDVPAVLAALETLEADYTEDEDPHEQEAVEPPPERF